jgi:hypothetical protein
MNWMVWHSNLGGVRDLLFSKPAQTGPGPTQPPVQWVVGILIVGKVARVLSLITHTLLAQRLKMG